MQNVLETRHQKTRLGLSKWAREAAHEATTVPSKLAVASDVAAVAKVMDRIWPQQQQGTVKIAIFSAAEDMPVIDV